MAQSKNWVGTSFAQSLNVPVDAVYLVYQQEICPSSGKMHWQFFCQMKSRVRLTGMKKLFPGAHLEVSRAPKEARLYCMKEKTRAPGVVPVEVGVFAEVEESVLGVLKRARAIDVLELHPHLWRSYRALTQIKADLQLPRTALTRGVLLSGKSGCGKTKIAACIAGFLKPEEVFWISNYPWFCGYEGQGLVIFDEFRGTSPEVTLRLLDRTPLRVQVKGGSVEWRPSLMIMTSNLTLRECFPTVDLATFSALERRINVNYIN